MLAGPAARVEEGARERAGVGEAENRGLGAADVPRRGRARVGVVPVVGGWVGCGHVTILAHLGKREALIRTAPRTPPAVGPGSPAPHRLDTSPDGGRRAAASGSRATVYLGGSEARPRSNPKAHGWTGHPPCGPLAIGRGDGRHFSAYLRHSANLHEVIRLDTPPHAFYGSTGAPSCRRRPASRPFWRLTTRPWPRGSLHACDGRYQREPSPGRSG